MKQLSLLQLLLIPFNIVVGVGYVVGLVGGINLTLDNIMASTVDGSWILGTSHLARKAEPFDIYFMRVLQDGPAWLALSATCYVLARLREHGTLPFAISIIISLPLSAALFLYYLGFWSYPTPLQSILAQFTAVGVCVTGLVLGYRQSGIFETDGSPRQKSKRWVLVSVAILILAVSYFGWGVLSYARRMSLSAP